MAETKKRRGVKPRVAGPGERRALGLMVTPEIKNKLDAAARSNGRSQSQEAETRLEQTFRNENYLDQAMELAYGPRLAVLLAIASRATTTIGHYAEFPASWMERRDLIENAVYAAKEIIEAFGPPADGVTYPTIIGQGIARSLLHAVKDPAQAGNLAEWAAPLYAKLGEEAASKLRVGPREVPITLKNLGEGFGFRVRRKEEEDQ